MTTPRLLKEILWLKSEYTTDQLLQMGNELALARLRMEDIKAEEEVAKAQTKEKKAQVELTIGTLSRKVVDKYEMVNISCTPIWDSPNVGEVTLVRSDTGEVARIRPMTETERQMDLPLGGDEISSLIDSAKNVAEFFDAEKIVKAAHAEDEPEPADPFTDPDPAAAEEATKPEHDAEFEAQEEPETPKPKPGRKPKGFSQPTNQSAIADDEPF